MNISKYLWRAILCTYVAGLCACMYMPAARDDFSAMENDPFSNLIRNGQYGKDNLEKRGRVGVSSLDPEKLTELSRAMFQEKQYSDVVEYFEKYGGECSSSKSREEETFSCSINRRWKIKNIGASFDMSNWPEPGVKFIFYFPSVRNITNFKLTIFDISLRKNY